MTLKTSLFNFGIFKNTIKRFKWGSLLYFVILFFCVPFTFFVQDNQRLMERFQYYGLKKVILTESYLVLPFILAVAVPTVVAVLVYHFVHSQKQGIAVHSLPVKRKENYISTVLASFVLMGVPVLLNAVILLIMSFLGYGKIFAPWSVVYWFFVNISILFIMFSVASFTAFLAGHPASHAIINVFVQGLPALVALFIVMVSDVFLYGFTATDTFIAEKILKTTPVVWITLQADEISNKLNFFKTTQFWVYMILAVLFYIGGYFLYKNRKIEASGEVVAFKAFRPILKYSIVASVALVMFGISNGMELGVVATIIVMAVATFITYFAIEMLMNKTFKVFNLYKGYIGFACVIILAGLFFSFTSVFGYETRIPDSDKIIKAGIYNSYGEEEPIVIDEKVISDVREIHSELIKDIPVFNSDREDNYEILYVAYQLESGKMLKRRYVVDSETGDRYLSKMYESERYKRKVTELDNINIDNVKNLTVRAAVNNFTYQIMLNEDSSEFLRAIEKDMETLTYEEIEKASYDINLYTEAFLTAAENKKQNVFKNAPKYASDEEEYMIISFGLTINSNYKNTFKFLKEKGYYDEFVDKIAENMYIYTEPCNIKGEEYKIKEDLGKREEFYVNPNDVVKIDKEDSVKLTNILFERKSGNEKDGKYYAVFCNSYISSGENLWFDSNVTLFKTDELPEYLKKYIAIK